MKILLNALCLAALAAAVSAAEPSSTIKTTAAQEAELARQEYAKFLAEVVKPENVADLVAVMDKVILQGEHGLVDKEPDPGLVEGTAKTGLRIEFSATDLNKKAIVYFLKISRGGPELRYDDATKFAALFTDRAGLTHPIEIIEGDNSTFTSRWIIKPSDWKKFRKQMVKARAENRAEKDLSRAFILAVERELEGRATARAQQSSR